MRENVRGIADLSISMAATTPLSLDLIKNTAVLLRLRMKKEAERGDTRGSKRGEREQSVLKPRGSSGAISILLYHFLPFSLRLRRGDYHLENAFLSIAFLEASRRRWRRCLDEIFIETPVDYSDATQAGARA